MQKGEKMKKMYFIVVPLVLFFMLAGCASTGSLDSSNVSADFQPKVQYAVSYDTAWDSVNKVLFDEGIITTSSEKGAGRILTDYVDGGTQFDPVQGVMTKRFKFSISIEKIDANTSSIKIIGKLESMTKRIAWHDISVNNKKQVANKVNSIYQKIETALNK